MKILYHHRTQSEDGQAVHIRELQRAFREEGHPVFEVALVGSGAGRGGWSWFSRLPRWTRELAEYAYPALARPRLIAEGRRRAVDLVYERYAFGNTAGLAAARALRRPLVLEVNSPMVLELSRTRGLALPGLARRIERHVFRGADVVCAVSGVLREILVAEGVPPGRIVVTPNGVDPRAFEGGDPAAARRLLGLPEAGGPAVFGFVGYVRQWHRLDLALEALARPELADAHLCLIGDGPALAGLRSRAAELGLEARVHFPGPRPHGEVPRLLAAFDVALLPAINEYASPLKLVESMAAGLPALAPDQPNLRELAVDRVSARLVAPGDAGALAAAMAELAGDAEQRRRLGRAARAVISERDLTWRGNVRRILEAVGEREARP